jgi:hypothetical protein
VITHVVFETGTCTLLSAGLCFITGYHTRCFH